MLDDGVVLEAKFGIEGGRAANDRIVVRGYKAPVVLEGVHRLKIVNTGGVKPDGMAFVLIDAEVPIGPAGTWEIDHGKSGWAGGFVTINPDDRTQLIVSGLKSGETSQ